MGTRYFCDNCGKEFDSLRTNDAPNLFMVTNIAKTRPEESALEQLMGDFCRECLTKLTKIIEDGFGANE